MAAFERNRWPDSAEWAGVIVKAHRMGRITLEEAELHLRRLAALSSLFVTPAIVELAIERLHGG